MLLRSKIGQILLNKISMGGSVQQISIKALKDLEIPILTTDQLEKVYNDFLEESDINKEITLLRKKAENILENVLSEYSK